MSSRKGLINAITVALKEHDNYLEEISGNADSPAAEDSVSHAVDPSTNVSGTPPDHDDHSVSSSEEVSCC